jgi:geranylgeranyl diphosphate synthase type I
MVGRVDLSDDDVARVQQAIVDTGALADLELSIDALVAEAVDAIRTAPIAPVAREALVELADYVSRRLA